MRALILLAVTSLTAAIPSPLSRRADEPANNFDLRTCPGYEAYNVVKSSSSLTANLKLNGKKCNAYADDLEELKLVVEYQAGEFSQ